MSKRRKFTGAFKVRIALEALRGDKTIQEIALRHGVHPNQVSDWKKRAIDGLSGVFEGAQTSASADREREVKDLHAKIGELTVENDFLSEALKPWGVTSARK